MFFQASYFNIDILKYQISAQPGANSCPIHIMSYWRCEEDHTDLRIDYKYNHHSMARWELGCLCLALLYNGGVKEHGSAERVAGGAGGRGGHIHDVRTEGKLGSRDQTCNLEVSRGGERGWRCGLHQVR